MDDKDVLKIIEEKEKLIKILTEDIDCLKKSIKNTYFLQNLSSGNWITMGSCWFESVAGARIALKMNWNKTLWWRILKKDFDGFFSVECVFYPSCCEELYEINKPMHSFEKFLFEV